MVQNGGAVHLGTVSVLLCKISERHTVLKVMKDVMESRSIDAVLRSFLKQLVNLSAKMDS